MNEEFKLLIESLGNQILEERPDSTTILSNLLKDTIKFRDKLKEETGHIFTVEDTKIAVEALETHLNGKPFPKNLSPEQKALAQIYIDRVVLFKTGL
ncbi:MAG: hypothetical protein ACE5D6_00370 [Candidatus Zixiibacteriota bacterium]